MIHCHDPSCDFAVTDEFHYWLHTKINHTVFQPGHTQDLIKQLLQQLTSSNDAIMEVKLKRADFLYTHRKPTPAPVPMVSETTTIVTPPPSTASSPVVTKTEMIEEEDVPSLEGKTEELYDETKNAFYIQDNDTPPPPPPLIPRKRPRDDDDVVEIKQAEDDEKPFEIEWAQSNADLCLNERDRRLRARYGHVARGGGDDTHPQYQLHLKVDERAVNQGLCFFNPELNTYYLKSRKVCLPGQTPKELIIMDLERPQDKLGYTHVEFYITAPEHDIRNIKIIPCENHRNEFSCKTFFNVFATNQKLQAEKVSNEENDAFRFDISTINEGFINFQMFFNCWTLCQKSGFSDKKQNMCLRTKLTGPNVDDIVITKTINVQQNPGRGAKVVCPKTRVYPYQQTKSYNVDGTHGKSTIKLKIKFSLDPVIEKTPLFNLDMYLYQLTSDLDQHAQYLHSRDVHNMVKFMHAHREFQFLKPSAGSSTDRKIPNPPGSSISEHQPSRRGRPRGSTNQISATPSETLRYLTQSASQRANSQLQGQQVMPTTGHTQPYSGMRPMVKNYGSNAQQHMTNLTYAHNLISSMQMMNNAKNL